MNKQTSTPPIRGSLISDLKQLPKPFYLLMAGTFVNRFGHFVIPFLAIYLRQLGFAPSVPSVLVVLPRPSSVATSPTESAASRRC